MATKEFVVFEYTCIVTFSDGSPDKRANLTKEYEPLIYSYFKMDVNDWDRQGMSMGNFKSRGNIARYAYFITLDQDKRNKKAKIQRRDEISYDELIKQYA